MPTAIILLSGGLDSTTVLAMACHAGESAHAVSFRYGQKHDAELVSAAAAARRYGVPHTVIDLDPRPFAASSLTGSGEVPTSNTEGIPTTYVPARNTVFLSLALALAETVGARSIHIGVNALDYSGYPDCRPIYIDAFQRMARLAIRDGERFEIVTPLIGFTKSQIVTLAVMAGVDLAGTVSCYLYADGTACGQCDACALRLKGFADAGVADPTVYRWGSSPLGGLLSAGAGGGFEPRRARGAVVRGAGRTSLILLRMLEALRRDPARPPALPLAEPWRAVFVVRHRSMEGYVRRLVAFLAPREPWLWKRVDVLTRDPEVVERRLRGTRDRVWWDHY